MITIRRFTAEDADAYRELRLRAHSRSPEFFASSLEEKLELSAADWAARVAALEGDAAVAFLAFDGETACGIVEGAIETEWRAVLKHLWVDPAYRGQKIPQDLIDAVSDWAGTEKGLPHLRGAIKPTTEVILKTKCRSRERRRERKESGSRS